MGALGATALDPISVGTQRPHEYMGGWGVGWGRGRRGLKSLSSTDWYWCTQHQYFLDGSVLLVGW